MKCHLDFTAFYGVELNLNCERELFHDGPHECNGFVWGYTDQSRDPFTQKRKRAAEKKEAGRKAHKKNWLAKLNLRKQQQR
jgi:hypothetical protein